MTIQEAQAAPIKLSNAKQLILNENSYIVRRVGDKSAILRRDRLKMGVAVETIVKGETRYVAVYSRLEEAVNNINDMVEDWKCL